MIIIVSTYHESGPESISPAPLIYDDDVGVESPCVP